VLRRLLAFLWLSSVPVWARAANLQLLWSAPSICPSAEQVRAQVDVLLGNNADDVLTRPLYVAASVRQEGEDRWSLELLWRHSGEDSVRRIEADSCSDLARAAALATALVIAPNAMMKGSHDSSGGDSSGETTSPQSRAENLPPTSVGGTVSRAQGSVVTRARGSVVEPQATAKVAPASRRVRASVFALGATEALVLPRVAIGATIGAGLHWGRWSARVSLGTYVPESWDEGQYSGMLWLTEMAIAPCYAIALGRASLSPCLAAELHGYRAESHAIEMSSRSRWGTAMAVGIGLELRYPLTPSVALLGAATMANAVVRPEFRLYPDTLVFKPEMTSWRVAIGASYDVI
jgi:hypothetical protein